MIIVLNSDQFGKKLRERRLKLHISQKALAKECGISVYRIRRLEQGRILEVDAEVMQKICAALQSTMEEMTQA